MIEIFFNYRIYSIANRP